MKKNVLISIIIITIVLSGIGVYKLMFGTELQDYYIRNDYEKMGFVMDLNFDKINKKVTINLSYPNLVDDSVTYEYKVNDDKVFIMDNKNEVYIELKIGHDILITNIFADDGSYIKHTFIKSTKKQFNNIVKQLKQGK